MTVAKLIDVAGQFRPGCSVLDVRAYGSGNLNDTYLITCGAEEEGRYILQRVNTHVFRHPALIMRNMRTFTEHVRARLAREPGGRRWVVPRVYATAGGEDYYLDTDGSFWRAMSFVANATCYQSVQGIAHAREAGYAIGRFHDLISDLAPDKLYDTLEGFHITPRYLAHYDDVLDRIDVPESPSVRGCMQTIAERRDWASVLEDAKGKGLLRLRPIHGDPKVNNIMIDCTTGQAVSIVDLDTVKPGLVHYDIGDCLRSCCNVLGEETEQVDKVRFDVDLCRAILEGYLSVARGFMSAHDCAYLYDCVRLIAFELGLRFFTDYLEGNVYFKAQHEEHNLMRARVQFQLTRSIEAQEGAIRAIVADLTHASSPSP